MSRVNEDVRIRTESRQQRISPLGRGPCGGQELLSWGPPDAAAEQVPLVQIVPLMATPLAVGVRAVGVNRRGYPDCDGQAYGWGGGYNRLSSHMENIEEAKVMRSDGRRGAVEGGGGWRGAKGVGVEGKLEHRMSQKM